MILLIIPALRLVLQLFMRSVFRLLFLVPTVLWAVDITEDNQLTQPQMQPPLPVVENHNPILNNRPSATLLQPFNSSNIYQNWKSWLEDFSRKVKTLDQLSEEEDRKLVILEKVFLYPLKPVQVSEYLGLFFWLPTEKLNQLKKLITSFQKKKMPMLVKFLNDHSLLKPFFKLPKKLTSKKSLNQEKFRTGIAIKSSRIKQVDDFYLLLHNYNLRNYAQYVSPSLELWYLADRDPNEYRVIDSLKVGTRIDINPSLSLFLGPLKISHAQRLLFSTGYPIRIDSLRPLGLKTIRPEIGTIKLDHGGSEIFLNGVALQYRSIQQPTQQTVHNENSTRDGTLLQLIAGEYQYDEELITNQILYRNEYLPSVDSFSLTPDYHELPLGRVLKEQIYLIHIAQGFSGSHSYPSKIATSFIYGKFNALLKTDHFQGDYYYGQSLSWSWLPTTSPLIDNIPRKSHLEFFGEITWLAVPDEPITNYQNQYGSAYYYNPESKEKFTWAFSGGLNFYLNHGDLLLLFQEIPPKYPALHRQVYQKNNNESSFYLGYQHKSISRLKWNFLGSFSLPYIEHLENSEQENNEYDNASQHDWEALTLSLQNYLSYQFESDYYLAQEIKLEEDAQAIGYQSLSKAGVNFSEPNDHQQFNLSFSLKLSGSSTSDYIPSLYPQLKFTYRQSESTTYQASYQLGYVLHNGADLQTSFYHNPFFRDNIYFDQNSFLAGTRQQFDFHGVKLGLSLGFVITEHQLRYIFDPEKFKSRLFFSGYLELNTES